MTDNAREPRPTRGFSIPVSVLTAIVGLSGIAAVVAGLVARNNSPVQHRAEVLAFVGPALGLSSTFDLAPALVDFETSVQLPSTVDAVAKTHQTTANEIRSGLTTERDVGGSSVTVAYVGDSAESAAQIALDLGTLAIQRMIDSSGSSVQAKSEEYAEEIESLTDDIDKLRVQAGVSNISQYLSTLDSAVVDAVGSADGPTEARRFSRSEIERLAPVARQLTALTERRDVLNQLYRQTLTAAEVSAGAAKSAANGENVVPISQEVISSRSGMLRAAVAGFVLAATNLFGLYLLFYFMAKRRSRGSTID